MSEEIERRVRAAGPKRILALDGGGVMGLTSLGYLERMEAVLAERAPDRERFRLSDYFDLIGGTSTGAIIATLLALGWKVEEVRGLYHELCPRVFARGSYSVRNFLSSLGLMSKFDTDQFAAEVDAAFQGIADRLGVGPSDLTLDTDQLKTGLAIVAKRADTNSVWVQTNIPGRKFWSPDDRTWWPDGAVFDGNRDYPLNTIVRASASAPYFFEEVALKISEQETGLFVDGGVSPHNNPSRELFLMAALSGRAHGARTPYALDWPTGAENILLVSIGTGWFRDRIPAEEFQKLSTLSKAIRSLRSMIQDCSNDSVAWLQALSEPRKPWTINLNLEDMAGLRLVDEPLLSYQRYNARLEEDLLTDLMGADWARENLTPQRLRRLREFDTPFKTNLRRLEEIGAAYAAREVEPEDFPAAFDV